ncbi:MAG: hypothetical protein HAW63_04595 [Bdellovibrionaceae bacterium]|nr:hypothetical protein [Pseudobdellovibrionaceae bacterium]
MLGEYLALQGGPSLLINTPKAFVLSIASTGEASFFKRISSKKTHPAFLLLEEYRKSLSANKAVVFKKFLKNCYFKDPYKASGGFGCSGAEFLSAYIITNLHKMLCKEKEITKTQCTKIWNNFLSVEKKEFTAFHKFKEFTNWGSGFDILSQLLGSIASIQVVDNTKNFCVTYKNFSWPFLKYNFAILKSQNKINTHEHLSQLSAEKLNILVKKLKPIVEKGISSIQASSIDDFLSAVHLQQSLLEQEGFVCSSSINKIKAFGKIKEILASKSCGALGADTFLIVYAKGNENLVKEKIKISQNLSSLLWVTEDCLYDGVNLEINNS